MAYLSGYLSKALADNYQRPKSRRDDTEKLRKQSEKQTELRKQHEGFFQGWFERSQRCLFLG